MLMRMPASGSSVKGNLWHVLSKYGRACLPIRGGAGEAAGSMP